MTIKEAAQLVIQSSVLSEGGDIFLLDMGNPVKIYDLAKQMVNLSGLSIKNENNINGDIEIISTGLRPGEKLFEELLINAKSKPTTNPRIFKAYENSIEFVVLNKILEELKFQLDNYNLEESLDILKKLVPEWKKN